MGRQKGMLMVLNITKGIIASFLLLYYVVLPSLYIFATHALDKKRIKGSYNVLFVLYGSINMLILKRFFCVVASNYSLRGVKWKNE